MREGVVFDEVSVYFLQSSFMRQAIRRLLSPELVFNYLPFQLVSLNPGFPENVQKRGNPNMKKFLSF